MYTVSNMCLRIIKFFVLDTTIVPSDIDSSDEFDFWGSNYRYLIIPVIIIIAVLIVAIMLLIKWKYYPSTVLYCKGTVCVCVLACAVYYITVCRLVYRVRIHVSAVWKEEQ